MLNYKKCLVIDSNHFGACLNLAKLLANLNEQQRAIKYFNHAIKIDADSIAAQLGLARALHSLSEDRISAVPHYEEVIKRDSQHYEALTWLGQLYLELEKYENSAQYL